MDKAITEAAIHTPQKRESTDCGKSRGGARPGAGRKPRKWAAARGLKIPPATAAEILERADERRIWYRLLDSQDDRIVLQAMSYLTDRRDGRPAQRVNVTSTSLTLNANDLEKARAIVREIRDGNDSIPGLGPVQPEETSPFPVDAQPVDLGSLDQSR